MNILRACVRVCVCVCVRFDWKSHLFLIIYGSDAPFYRRISLHGSDTSTEVFPFMVMTYLFTEKTLYGLTQLVAEEFPFMILTHLFTEEFPFTVLIHLLFRRMSLYGSDTLFLRRVSF